MALLGDCGHPPPGSDHRKMILMVGARPASPIAGLVPANQVADGVTDLPGEAGCERVPRAQGRRRHVPPTPPCPAGLIPTDSNLQVLATSPVLPAS